MSRYRGLTVRGQSTSVAHMASHRRKYTSPTKPGQALMSIEVEWKDLQPTAPGALHATAVAELDAAITDAHTYGYQLLIRVSTGLHSPGGISRAKMSGTTLPDPDTLFVPITSGTPTSTQYIPGWLEATNFGHWSPGSPNPHPVAFINTYSSDPNPGFAGFPHHFPYHADAGQAYWHNELLVLLSAFHDGDCPYYTAHGGTQHPRSDHIHSWPTSRPCEVGTEMTISYGNNSASGYTNQVERNRAQWDAFDTETNREIAFKAAWLDTVDDFLNANANWYGSIAGGQIFTDGFAAATAIRTHVDGLSAAKKARMLFMTTNLNNDPASTPLWQSSLAANWLKACQDAGYRIGLQFSTYGDSTLAHMQGSIQVARNKLGSLNSVDYVEPNPARVPNPDPRYDYMLTVQSELQRAPAPPTGLAAADGPGTSVLLSWVNGTDADDDMLGTEIERRTSSGGAFAKVGEVRTTGFGIAVPVAYTDDPGVATTGYGWRVRHFDLANPAHYSTYSNIVEDPTQPPDTTPPTVPGSPLAVQDATGVQFTHTASTDTESGVKEYRYWRREVATQAAPGTLLATIPAPSTAFHDDNPPLGLMEYSVDATDNADPANTSARGTAAQITVVDTEPPTWEAGTVILYSTSPTSISLWTSIPAQDNVGVDHYEWTRTGGGGGPVNTNTATNELTDGTVAAGATYQYDVSAWDAAGNESDVLTVFVTAAAGGGGGITMGPPGL